MTTQSFPALQTGDRRAGWLAIISGAFGIVAFACLIVFLVTRPSEADQWTAHVLLRSHDVGIILQSLCLIPFVLALDAVARQRSAASSRAIVAAAVGFLILIAALMVLSFVDVVADVLYMIPQGAVGVWLLVVCRQSANGLPRGLRRLGVVAGLGLILVSLFPIGYSLFVDPAIFHGPISDDDPTPPGTDRANGIVHLALGIGTMIGCSTYPVWSALAGRWLLLREGRKMVSGTISPGSAPVPTTRAVRIDRSSTTRHSSAWTRSRTTRAGVSGRSPKHPTGELVSDGHGGRDNVSVPSAMRSTAGCGALHSFQDQHALTPNVHPHACQRSPRILVRFDGRLGTDDDVCG